MSINEGKKKKKLEYFLLPNQYHPMEQISGGSLTQEEIKPIKTVINQSLQSWNQRKTFGRSFSFVIRPLILVYHGMEVIISNNHARTISSNLIFQACSIFEPRYLVHDSM